MRRKQVQKEAAEELARLREFQAQKYAASIPFYIQTSIDGYIQCDKSTNDSDLVAIAEHEEMWKIFETKKQEAITTHDIPWPPFGNDYEKYLILSSEYHYTIREGSGSHNIIMRRKAYTKACLRWHPDKFSHKFGKYVSQDDRSRIEKRVQEIAQGVNQAWAALSSSDD